MKLTKVDITTKNSSGSLCIGFNTGSLEKKSLEEESFSIAYEPQMNSYNGTTTIQLVLTNVQFE
ncbi:MAG: hypothetical protein Q7T18_05825 [Sedimentisphaerales bacterium]|nr:hypothetical protein [Sedimentisphaerales bacterium]